MWVVGWDEMGVKDEALKFGWKGHCHLRSLSLSLSLSLSYCILALFFGWFSLGVVFLMVVGG